MNTIALVFIVIVLSDASAGYGWIEGRWVSHADTSIEANPDVAQFDEETLEKFRSLFGNTIWDISNGMFTAIQGGTLVSTAPYSISPTKDDRFEIIIDAPDIQSVFLVWPTALGFCAKIQPQWISQIKAWTKPEIVECYVPADA